MCTCIYYTHACTCHIFIDLGNLLHSSNCFWVFGGAIDFNNNNCHTQGLVCLFILFDKSSFQTSIWQSMPVKVLKKWPMTCMESVNIQVEFIPVTIPLYARTHPQEIGFTLMTQGENRDCQRYLDLLSIMLSCSSHLRCPCCFKSFWC